MGLVLEKMELMDRYGILLIMITNEGAGDIGSFGQLVAVLGRQVYGIGNG